MKTQRLLVVVVLLLLLAAAKAAVRERPDTQGSATASSQGYEPGGPGDAFSWQSTEASAIGQWDGAYYKDGGATKTVLSGDMAQGGWSGSYMKQSPDDDVNPGGTTETVGKNFEPEFLVQRGTNAIAATYEGARATAGSGALFSASSEPGGVVSATLDTYAGTPQDRVTVNGRGGDGSYPARSAGLTGIAPLSAANSGSGNGPMAAAAGLEVSAMARGGRDYRPLPDTVGHRGAGGSSGWPVFDHMDEGAEQEPKPAPAKAQKPPAATAAATVKAQKAPARRLLLRVRW